MLINDKDDYIKMFLEFRENGFSLPDLDDDMEFCDVIHSKFYFYTKEFFRNKWSMLKEKGKALLGGEINLDYYKNREDLLYFGCHTCDDFYDY